LTTIVKLQSQTAICDFCSSPHVEWAYRSREAAARTGQIGFSSDAAWAACTPCHLLIQQGAREALQARSIESYPSYHPDEPCPQLLLERFVRMVHDVFWSTKTDVVNHFD
jgi:hypothetical protein